MNKSNEIYRQFYENALSRPHFKRTEFAIRLNESSHLVAIDCGCGTGSDAEYLQSKGYHVYAFDINADAIAICKKRFALTPLVDVIQASFESFNYPNTGIVIANSSLFFAQPNQFQRIWQNIVLSLDIGGVFAGDFMEIKDSWASNYDGYTSPLTKSQVELLFLDFEVIRFIERDEQGKTSLGKVKYWHTFSVVAVKRK